MKVIRIILKPTSIILFVVIALSCCLLRDNTTSTSRIFPLPGPDPIDVQGDSLYAIYRKGLITRHITKNGRLLVTTALESIDDFSQEQYDSSGYITIKRLDGSIARKVAIDHTRYSEELVPGTHNISNYLWVPVIAPVKNSGLSNDGYYVASGASDNPLYYGGMALAAFSLEHIHNVSPHSINYARKLVEYFLASEMTGKNGYIIRRPHHFSYYTRNIEGEPITQGASVEELLGMMLGLMYYLRAENPNTELYKKARALRDRVLHRITNPSMVIDCVWPWPPIKFYEHDLMISAHNPYYQVNHFSFPLHASAGTILDTPMGDDCSPFEFYCNFTDGSGGSDVAEMIAQIFGGAPFDSYAMFLTASILIFEGDIPIYFKKMYAEVFMKYYIKGATTSSFDGDKLFGNAYFGVVAKLANKYLNSTIDSEIESTLLYEIWDDDLETWNRLKWDVDFLIVKPKSVHNKDWSFDTPTNKFQWQHNLPLCRPTPSIPDNIWKDFNPHNRIGAYFTWKDSKPYHYVKKKHKWYANFPGWPNLENANGGKVIGEMEYKESITIKKYRNYLQKEIVQLRGHHNNQVEGVGLDLLFPRMLLTEINPQKYPAPTLPDDYDKSFKILPWNGVEPSHPQSLYYQFRYWSRDEEQGIDPFEIGDEPHKGISIQKYRSDDDPSCNFAVIYANDDNLLSVRKGFVSDGFNSGGTEYGSDIYLGTDVDVRGNVDEIKTARINDGHGSEYIIIAERAEEDGICGFCCDHWLRLSVWRVSGYAEGHVGSMSRTIKWAQDEDTRHCNSVRELDLTTFGDKYVAVSFLSDQDKQRAIVFEIDYENNKLNMLQNKIITSSISQETNAITNIDDLIILQSQRENGWKIESYKWAGTRLDLRGRTFQRTENLLDIQTIRRIDYNPGPDDYYLVAVTENQGDLVIWSWQVNSNGSLEYKGSFDLSHPENYLLGRETGWETAVISPFFYLNRCGFVIAGKGIGRVVKDKESGEWKETDKAVKILYGSILEEGRPTIESSSIIGSGNSDIEMIDATANLIYDDLSKGVLVAHKTKDDHLMITFWTFEDLFKNTRWTNE